MQTNAGHTAITNTMNQKTRQRIEEHKDERVTDLLEANIDDEAVIEEAVDIMGWCFEDGKHIAREPRTIAAGISHISYQLVGENHTQTELADRFDVTPLTLRRCRNDTLRVLGIYEMQND